MDNDLACLTIQSETKSSRHKDDAQSMDRRSSRRGKANRLAKAINEIEEIGAPPRASSPKDRIRPLIIDRPPASLLPP